MQSRTLRLTRLLLGGLAPSLQANSLRLSQKTRPVNTDGRSRRPRERRPMLLPWWRSKVRSSPLMLRKLLSRPWYIWTATRLCFRQFFCFFFSPLVSSSCKIATAGEKRRVNRAIYTFVVVAKPHRPPSFSRIHAVERAHTHALGTWEERLGNRRLECALGVPLPGHRRRRC